MWWRVVLLGTVAFARTKYVREAPDSTVQVELHTADATSNAVTVPLVTGGGRGGTHSIAKWLNSIGVPAVHEGASKGKVSVSWWYAADSSDMDPAVDHRDGASRRRGLHFSPVVHVVREPLAHINSLSACFCGKGDITGPTGAYWDRVSFEYASKYVRMLSKASETRNRLLMAAIYWLRWNQLADRHADSRFRIEDLDTSTFLRALNMTSVDKSTRVTVSSVREAIRDKRTRSLTWQHISEKLAKLQPGLVSELWCQAKAWGYDYPGTLNMPKCVANKNHTSYYL